MNGWTSTISKRNPSVHHLLISDSDKNLHAQTMLADCSISHASLAQAWLSSSHASTRLHSNWIQAQWHTWVQRIYLSKLWAYWNNTITRSKHTQPKMTLNSDDVTYTSPRTSTMCYCLSWPCSWIHDIHVHVDWCARLTYLMFDTVGTATHTVTDEKVIVTLRGVLCDLMVQVGSPRDVKKICININGSQGTTHFVHAAL